MWEGYAKQKIALAFEKLVGSPNAPWAGGPFAEAQSDLSAVSDEDVPEDAVDDLNAVKNATSLDIEMVRAISRLHVKALESERGGA